MPTVTIISAALGLVLVGQAQYFAAVMDYAYSHDIRIGTGTSGYSTPLFVLGAVRDAIPPDIDDVIVLSDGDRVWFDVEAARWPVMLRDQTRCVRTLPSDGFYVLPDGRYAVITTPTASDEMQSIYVSREEEGVIPVRIGEGRYLIDIHEADGAQEPTIARFANGPALLSWTLDDDENLAVLSFRLPDAPDRTFYGALDHDYQYFIHLLDADGNRIGQKDASFWPGRHWCENDRLTLMATVENAAEVATLRFGFYKLLDAKAGTTQAVDILDEAGNSAGNWVDVPVR